MDTRFFKSKEFVIAAVVAVALAAGAVVAASVSFGTGEVFSRDGCHVVVPSGTELTADRQDTGTFQEDGRVKRVVTYTLADAPAQGGDVNACTKVGDVDVLPSSDGQVHVRFTIVNHGSGAEEAVRDTQVEARFLDQDGALGLAAWQANHLRAEQIFDSQSTSVALEIEVPVQAIYAIDVHTDVGDVTLSAIKMRSLAVQTDVGDIEAQGVTVQRNVDARTDVGDIDLEIASVGTGFHTLRTDVGDIDLVVPGSQDNGYIVDAETDVGGIEVNIGETEHHVEDSRGPSHEAHARTRGYAEKPNQVTIDARTDVGSIEILAR